MALRGVAALLVGTLAAAAIAAAGWFLLRDSGPGAPVAPAPGIGSGDGEPTPIAPVASPSNGGGKAGAPDVEDGDPDDDSDLDRDPSGESGGASAEDILAALARGGPQDWLDAERLIAIAGCDDPRVTEALLKAMSDGRWRLKAASMAKHLKDPAALARFLELARADGDENTRSAALLACANMGGSGVQETVMDVLRAARPGSILAATAATALGTLGTPDATRVLLESLRQSLGSPQQATYVAALGEIRDPEAIAILTTMLADQATDANMRSALVTALGRTGDPSVVPTLLEVARGDSPETLKFEAYRALGRVGSPEAVDALLNVLAGGDNLHKQEAATALQQVTAKAAAPLIEQALDRPVVPELRSYLIDTLGRIGSKSSVPLLSKIAGDAAQPPGDRVASIRSLGAIADPGGAEPALRILEEPRTEPALRMAALGTLSSTATAADIARIEELLKSTPKGTPEWVHLDAILRSLKAGGTSSPMLK
jgi:HEAT repeat protein